MAKVRSELVVFRTVSDDGKPGQADGYLEVDSNAERATWVVRGRAHFSIPLDEFYALNAAVRSLPEIPHGPPNVADYHCPLCNFDWALPIEAPPREDDKKCPWCWKPPPAGQTFKTGERFVS